MDDNAQLLCQWVLGIQTQIFMLVEQALLPTKPPLQPSLLIFITFSYFQILLICRRHAYIFIYESFMGSSVGNVTSLLDLTSFSLWFLWMVNFFLVGTFVISRELFLSQGHENALMVFSSKFAVSCFMFKSTVYMTFVFPLCRLFVLPFVLPSFFFFLLITEIEPKDSVTAKMFHTTQLYSWPMTPVKLTSVTSIRLCSIHWEDLSPALHVDLFTLSENPSLVCSDMPLSLPSTSVTNYSVGFPHIFKFHDNFMLIDNDL